MHAQVNTQQVAANSAASTALTAGFGQSETQAFETVLWSTALMRSPQPQVSPASSPWLAAWMREE